MTVRYVYEPRKGLSNARNMGIAAAQGETIVFTDDDVRPSPEWLQNLTCPIAFGKADAVLGGVQLASELVKPWMEAHHKMMLSSTEDVDPDNPFSLVGANMAFSRNVLTKVPGFDVKLGAGAIGFGEDTLFSLQLKQANYKIVTAFDAQVEHHFDPSRLSRSSLLHRAIGEGQFLAYLAHHWEHREVPHAPILLIKRHLRLRFWRAKRRSECVAQEGISAWEMMVLQGIGFYERYIIERQRPRNYKKYGLVKLHNDLE